MRMDPQALHKCCTSLQKGHEHPRILVSAEPWNLSPWVSGSNGRFLLPTWTLAHIPSVDPQEPPPHAHPHTCEQSERCQFQRERAAAAPPVHKSTCMFWSCVGSTQSSVTGRWAQNPGSVPVTCSPAIQSLLWRSPGFVWYPDRSANEQHFSLKRVWP